MQRDMLIFDQFQTYMNNKIINLAAAHQSAM